MIEHIRRATQVTTEGATRLVHLALADMAGPDGTVGIRAWYLAEEIERRAGVSVEAGKAALTRLVADGYLAHDGDPVAPRYRLTWPDDDQGVLA